MVQKRVRSHSKTSASMTLGQTMRCRSIFGEPPLLAGEDAAAFDELYDRVRAAVKPANILEEMFIFEVMCAEWEVLRWRRLKLSSVKVHAFNALVHFLSEKLDYELYSEFFVNDLAQIIQDNLTEDEADSAQTLALNYFRNQDAFNKVNRILSDVGRSTDSVLAMAQWHKAKELVQKYFRGESEATILVHEILTKTSRSIDAFMADALAEKLDFVERIDRLGTSAESRRDDSLHQIDRRRALFGERLRQTVQQVEHDELEVIEMTPTKGKKAA
jgi:hypothetical protein